MLWADVTWLERWKGWALFQAADDSAAVCAVPPLGRRPAGAHWFSGRLRCGADRVGRCHDMAGHFIRGLPATMKSRSKLRRKAASSRCARRCCSILPPSSAFAAMANCCGCWPFSLGFLGQYFFRRDRPHGAGHHSRTGAAFGFQKVRAGRACSPLLGRMRHCRRRGLGRVALCARSRDGGFSDRFSTNTKNRREKFVGRAHRISGRSRLASSRGPVIGHGTGTIRRCSRAPWPVAGRLRRRRPIRTTRPSPSRFSSASSAWRCCGRCGSRICCCSAVPGCSPGSASWSCVQNIVGSLFNSHLFDFGQGWVYVLGVGVAGGHALRKRDSAPAS